MEFSVLVFLYIAQLSFALAAGHGKVLYRRQNLALSSSSLSSSTVAPSAASPPVSFATPQAATNAPPLASIMFGMPSAATLAVSATYEHGATPPVPSAPGLPTPFVFQSKQWPPQDRIPDTNSPEVQEWMKELEGFYIPDIPPTTDGSCAGDIEAAAQAAQRGWWTCGGHTRSTDITACPDKGTWGVSFDDGPGPYTQNVLNFLNSKDIHATFFVVGSRVIERPGVLIEEYMAGHEISVHTWSHKPLTSLTNAEVVAELGWTRKAIKQVLNVTPTTMRPPYGDIDDRIRALALAMGMVPILWTRTPSGGVFDTNDWRVAAGEVTGVQSFQTFQTILNNASNIDTGCVVVFVYRGRNSDEPRSFIVLQHDVHEATVDLAVGYTLDAALNHNPPYTLKAIGECTKTPAVDLYLETTQNSTFPYPNRTQVNVNGDGKTEVNRGTGEMSSALFIQSSVLAVLLAAAAATSTLTLF